MTSQEHEDELKWTDLQEDAEDNGPRYFSAPRPPLGWRDRLAIGTIAAGSVLLMIAVVLGLREEWKIVGRLFQ